jgi:sortase (surface protein transpeptidase)
MLVIVPDVVAKDGFEMVTAKNERPVETLFTCGPYPVSAKNVVQVL